MTTPVQDGVPELRNRLGDETSPYLLQHAGNPVHWQPWGPQAFELARRLDRPIFLSVGYSTCYWCHVMERESFESDDIAAILNEHFVCIKVDREERPDVDEIYMNAVYLLNQGQGGWPMSVWLEPTGLEPFLGGTYFPPDDRGGRPGFASVLEQVAGFWRDRRPAIEDQARRVADAVAARLAAVPEPVGLDGDVVETAIAQLMGMYDPEHGGFGRGRNKFPVPANLDFLIAAGWERPAVRAALLHTLDRMALGGMYDQVGGGFHRYSTDPEWLVPHFEKMLYDNGQLASTYAEAHARTGDVLYGRIVREVLDYVLREMTEPTGAFRSAQDAEVNHLEGGNYLWVPDEIRSALRAHGLAEEVDHALEIYGLAAGTNFVDPHHPEAGRKNVLYLAARPEDPGRLDRIDAALLSVRDRRDQPLTDDKVLTAWNGLMIAGFADGGRILGEERYLEAARRAARWLLEHHRSSDGGLLRTSRGGAARIDAFLEDYAFLAHGLLALARSGADAWALDAARELTAEADRRFRDEAHGGWFDTRAGQSDLFVRVKTDYDGATPSGHGIMLLNLLRLHGLTGDSAYLDDAIEALRGRSRGLASGPAGAILSVLALHRALPVAGAQLAGAAAAGPARIGAVPETVRVEPGGSTVVTVRLDIAEGHHATAHEPGQPGLSPLEVRLVEGTGWSIVVDYPAGEPFAGPLGSMQVHHGTVEIPVTVRRATDGSGTTVSAPTLVLEYQLCTDAVCLAPTTARVPVRIIATD